MTDSGVLFLADSVIYHVAYSVHSEGGNFFRLFRVRLHPLRSRSSEADLKRARFSTLKSCRGARPAKLN